MKAFFKGVRKHIDKLDAQHLREQYTLVADEFARSEMLLHALKEGIIRLGANGEVLQSNPAARTLLGMEVADILPDLALPLAKSSKREITITYPEPRTLEVQTIPLGDETVVYLRDITAEKQRTEEELRAGATEAVRDLASGVAHEIGNPLNAIALSLQLLKRDPADRETIEVCESQVERLKGILHGFLQALRPSKPNLVAGSAADPVTATLAALKPQFEEHRMSVELDLPAALPPVALDKSQMEQVYFNLLKNSLEAMTDGGSVRISLASDDNDVIVTLKDSGVGMDADQIIHLFEPYRTSKEHGTGLGLMISQRIVRDHGGQIAVESEKHRGTVFTVRLPRLERRIRALK